MRSRSADHSRGATSPCRHAAAGDDNVLVIFQVRFTSRETGGFIDTQVAEFYSVTDGQVSKINIFYKDTKAFAEELGFA